MCVYIYVHVCLCMMVGRRGGIPARGIYQQQLLWNTLQRGSEPAPTLNTLFHSARRYTPIWCVIPHAHLDTLTWAFRNNELTYILACAVCENGHTFTGHVQVAAAFTPHLYNWRNASRMHIYTHHLQKAASVHTHLLYLWIRAYVNTHPCHLQQKKKNGETYTPTHTVCDWTCRRTHRLHRLQLKLTIIMHRHTCTPIVPAMNTLMCAHLTHAVWE